MHTYFGHLNVECGILNHSNVGFFCPWIPILWKFEYYSNTESSALMSVKFGHNIRFYFIYCYVIYLGVWGVCERERVRNISSPLSYSLYIAFCVKGDPVVLLLAIDVTAIAIRSGQLDFICQQLCNLLLSLDEYDILTQKLTQKACTLWPLLCFVTLIIFFQGRWWGPIRSASWSDYLRQ